jgi:hypothetical protein
MDITEQVVRKRIEAKSQTLGSMVDVLSSHEKPQDQLEVALVRVSELTKSPIGLLLRSDSSNGALHIQAWYGIENPAVKDLPLEVTRLFQTMLADNSALIQNHAPIKCPPFRLF